METGQTPDLRWPLGKNEKRDFNKAGELSCAGVKKIIFLLICRIKLFLCFSLSTK
jgi:hypothetical protein